jgi:hypothetical protein
MKRYLNALFFLIFIFTFSLSGTPSMAWEKQQLDSTWNNWNFRISPFFWYIGFEGTIYRPPQLVQYPIPPPPKYEIDVGFKDIKNSIKFALMLAGQYRNEYIVTQFNFSSLILESEAITPLELLLQDNIVNLNYFSGDFGLGYRVVKHPKFEFDAMLGLKFIYFKIGLKTNLVGKVEVEGERDELWIDPTIGTNLIYRPHRKIEFVGYADYGPPFPDNVNSYQAMIGANYLFTKTFMITLGYRAYHIDFPKEEAIFNGTIKGWIMRIGFQF